MAVANGFGVCWRSGSCTKGDKYWYCNDCWPNPQAACHKPSIRFPKNGVSVVWDSTVPHYSVSTAFYGGWSCEITQASTMVLSGLALEKGISKY